MSRVNLGNSDQYVEQAEGTTWDVQIANFDVSRAVSSLEFEDAISQPGNFKIDLVVDPGDITGGDQVTISKEEVGAFNGVVTKPERSSQRDDVIKGGGAAELLSDIPINGEFLSTNTQSVVSSIFSQLSTTAIEVGLNEELSDGNGNVDVRAEDEGALNLLNRVVLSHGGDWYVTYDSQNDVYKFNVVNELSNSTSRTFGDEAIDELRDVQVVDEEYDAVVVKGYGDGDDQIIGEFPARNTWPDDPKILRYTDKTILSSEEANTTAENVYNEHTEWRNIYLYPANENELLSLGDEVEIDDSATGVNATFRVVQRKLHVSFSSPAAIEYVLSDRPIGVLDEGEDIREQTDSQTDYSQGNRNTINESNSDIANSSQGVEVDLNIPERFTQDATGEDRTAQVKLDYKIKDYKKIVEAENADALAIDNKADDQYTEVTQDIDDFGNVEKRFTGTGTGFGDNNQNRGNYTTEDISGFANNIDAGSFEAGSYTDGGDYNEADQVTLTSDSMQGVFITGQVLSLNPGISISQRYGDVYNINDDGNPDDVVLFNDNPVAGTLDTVVNDDDNGYGRSQYFRILIGMTKDTDGNGTDETEFFPGQTADRSTGDPIFMQPMLMADLRIGATFSIFVPGDWSDADMRIWVDHFLSSGTDSEDWEVLYNYYAIDRASVPDAEDAADTIQVYVQRSDDENFDIEDGSENTTNVASKNDTVSFNELPDDALVLDKEPTEATEAEIIVNGTTVSSGTGNLEETDFDITDDVNKPGSNTIEVRPTGGPNDSKAEVKANVIVDHKLEGDRDA